MAGEATFWMVDQAVLSLAKEQPLDPLPPSSSTGRRGMVARDTRNMAFGVIPLIENRPAATRPAISAWRTSPSAAISRPSRSMCRG